MFCDRACNTLLLKVKEPAIFQAKLGVKGEHVRCRGVLGGSAGRKNRQVWGFFAPPQENWN